ncbi:MAG: hypothetical protein EPO38_11940 [Rhizorhabdus sp.]|nr:MAG: hypothetical protein EPO38_11940 [Rhizorhabdus sp.]
MPACKRHRSALPVLTYCKYATVLDRHHFRLGLNQFMARPVRLKSKKRPGFPGRFPFRRPRPRHPPPARSARGRARSR